MKFTVKYISSIRLGVILGVMLIFVLAAEISYASATPEYIRIGLKYGSSSAGEYTATFENGVKLISGDNNGFSELAVFENVRNITVSANGGTVRVMGITDSGQSLWLNETVSGANGILPAGSAENAVFTIGSNKYRGGILFNTQGGSLNFINYIKTEEYLYGVINGELNKSNPAEALKAQAVVARSYAACKLGNHNSYGFDLCASTHCQVYKGYSDEYPETIAAVDETRGETVKYKGAPVAAFFYKNSGGYTQASEDVWVSAEGYLKAVKDEYSPSYPWSKTYTFDELSSKLSAAGYNVGTVTSVSITKRNQSGAVDTLQFVGTGGTAVLQRDKIRSVLGSTVIKSTMFTFGQANSGNARTSSTEEYSMQITSKTANAKLKEDERFYAIGKDGSITKLSAEDVYLQNSAKLQSAKELFGRQSGNTGLTGTESVNSGSVTFSGFGYGHGVGLPQDSAVEMAKEGFTYDEILKYYYADITVD